MCFVSGGGKQANFAGAPGARSASLHRWRRFNRRERRASPRRLPSAHSHTSASIPAHRPAKENVPQQSKWDPGNFFRPALEKKSLRTQKKTPKLMSVVPLETKAGLFTVSSPPIEKKKKKENPWMFPSRGEQKKKKKRIYVVAKCWKGSGRCDSSREP